MTVQNLASLPPIELIGMLNISRARLARSKDNNERAELFNQQIEIVRAIHHNVEHDGTDSKKHVTSIFTSLGELLLQSFNVYVLHLVLLGLKTTRDVCPATSSIPYIVRYKQKNKIFYYTRGVRYRFGPVVRSAPPRSRQITDLNHFSNAITRHKEDFSNSIKHNTFLIYFLY